MNEKLIQSKTIESNGCWIWSGAKDKDGYGKLRWNKRYLRAHRWAYEVSYGTIPDGLHVCHACDNPSCCNPGHLFLGTNAENRRDSVQKGRQARGRRSGMVKLTKEQVIYIRSSRQTAKVLAAQFKVSISLIYQIKTKQVWKHV
jgi:hypothetical protein